MGKYGREYTNVECGDLALGLEWDVCMALWKKKYIYSRYIFSLKKQIYIYIYIYLGPSSK